LSRDEFYVFQLAYEIGDVMQAHNASHTDSTRYSMSSRKGLHDPNTFGMHCSVLIKLSADGQHLYASHDTWSGFSSMLRIYKHYDWAFSSGGSHANGVSLSGYPGTLVSGDDFYITSQNLMVTETTNDVMNATLFEYVTAHTVPYWVRITVANRMGTSGASWNDAFGLYNSGTYNNQWIVVDYKLFVPGQPLASNTLWITEQIPGALYGGDATAWLASNGYWASYNIPYYPYVWTVSGYPAYYQKYGAEWSWHDCARANIFRRDQHAVQSLPDMQRIMRYNEWQTDVLAKKDSCKQISARCDLNPPWAVDPLNSYSAFGGVDSKITSNALSSSRVAMAVNGPTWDSQPPFAWTHQWPYDPHFGQSKVFAFDWTTMAPDQP
jgi:hypothetical protein